MTETTITVSGMKCGHCVNAVTSELTDLGGVSNVTIDLVPAGDSPVTITSDAPLDPQAVTAAVAEAGDYAVTF